ncbi:MAG: Calvin cycle protein CP12 [Nostocaceae cyanobacterium]|nr:Calvin cycle protein CP12 [Nostocaceae cyanobacterium]
MSKTLEVLQAAITADENGVKSLETSILEAIAKARTTCEQTGNDSQECAVAWDIVEELQAEKAHQQQGKKRKTDLERYCEKHPEAIECRVYDV